MYILIKNATIVLLDLQIYAPHIQRQLATSQLEVAN
jgi:hypothetical protein